jgi:uncharacterized protein YqhQ
MCVLCVPMQQASACIHSLITLSPLIQRVRVRSQLLSTASSVCFDLLKGSASELERSLAQPLKVGPNPNCSASRAK